MILLTSDGAKTSKLRMTPLMRAAHDGTHAVVAWLDGAPKHPVWYHSLKVNQDVELQDRNRPSSAHLLARQRERPEVFRSAEVRNLGYR